MKVLTKYWGRDRILLLYQPVLVEVVEVSDVLLTDQVFLPPASLPHPLQSHFGVSLSTNYEVFWDSFDI